MRASSRIIGTKSSGSQSDPLWSRVVVLTQGGVESNISTQSTYSDVSATPEFTIKPTGSAGSILVGTNRRIDYSNNGLFNDFSQGYTYEGYFYFNSLTADGSGTNYFMSRWNNSSYWQTSFLTKSGPIGWAFRQNNTASDLISLTTSSSISVNTWNHIAFSIIGNGSSGTAKIYLNGVESASQTYNAALNTNNSDQFSIAWKKDSNTYYGANFYVDGLRLTAATRYSSNFTPPSLPLPTS
jgi:hypothetical protein